MVELPLSCQRCNRPEKDDGDTLRGKANEFPIQDEAHRCHATCRLHLTRESPRLLDPCVQADCELLAHGIDGEVKPAAPIGTWEYQRATTRLTVLGFNEWNTPEEQEKISGRPLAKLFDSEAITRGPPSSQSCQNTLSNDHEYSSYFRSAIGTHRDKAWMRSPSL